jgi:uncharacterized protein
MQQKDSSAWNPYLAGALSGVVGILSVWIAGKYFGASTSFVVTAGLIEQVSDRNGSPGWTTSSRWFLKSTGSGCS